MAGQEIETEGMRTVRILATEALTNEGSGLDDQLQNAQDRFNNLPGVLQWAK